MRTPGGAVVVLLALAGCEWELDLDVFPEAPRVDRLDPRDIPQFTTALPIPKAMTPAGSADGVTEYRVAARQIHQQVLPEGFPATDVFAYGDPADPTSFHWPGWTIETRRGEPVRVEWINDLVDEDGDFLPHLLPIDATLHWANPPGPIDSEGDAPDYDGPVPIVTHVHGAHVDDTSDGLPQAWYLPDAEDIPAGYARQGTRYATEQQAPRGSAIFEYPNDRGTATLLYHDHALGITRLNVYAGLLGFYVMRDVAQEWAMDLPGPGPRPGDAAGTAYYEIPLAIQDRSFWDDGSLYYPDSRAAFDGYEGPYWPETDVPPVWNPEFFGDVMTVNGATWPYLEVEPRLYRFRLANGSNSRFLFLDLDDPSLEFVLIGTEGGWMTGAPVVQPRLLMGPAERFDVLIDFSGLAPGDSVELKNLGPDEPFKGFGGDEPPPAADPETTGRVMQFRVVPLTTQGDAGSIPATLPKLPPLSTSLPPRDLLLWENATADDVVSEALLGSVAAGPLEFDAPVTEVIGVDDTEVWRIVNTTADAHPIHLHLVQFQVVGRSAFYRDAFVAAEEMWLQGTGPQPAVDSFLQGAQHGPWADETGWKDTVIAYPGEVTSIVATFDKEGSYVWHCHILEHEDNEMMRPFTVE